MYPRVSSLLSVLLMALAPAVAHSAAEVGKDGQVTLKADFRLRFESDWDSVRANGSERADRDRLRARLRGEVAWKPSDSLTFAARARTGSRDSQQSPHVTVHDFEGNPTGDHDVLLDKWYVRFASDRAWGWVGRNSMPFWRPNELFWDDDVTPAGFAFGFDPAASDRGKLSLVAGYFTTPDGATAFGPEAAGLQLAYKALTGRPGFTTAVGFLAIEGDDGSEHLRQGNGARDYALWTGNFQVRTEALGQPLQLGLDFMHNSEDYSPVDADSFTAANHDQVDGWDAYVQWGSLANKGDWLAGVWYARIEALAVHASYAQDDWVRWGSATQTDSSDLGGFELRVARKLGPRQDLVARLYLVEALASVQDGNRFRLDYNLSF